MKIVILGLSITSSWGNGHATTYRSLVRGLASRGHDVLFLERDAPWYAGNRDKPKPAGVETRLYDSLDELFEEYEKPVREADLVIVGSFVSDGIMVGEWVLSIAKGVTAFYDIDTPITVERLRQGACEYVTAGLIGSYDLYLSFTAGPLLKSIEQRFGSPMARPLYCSVDPQTYSPVRRIPRWDLGYLGTYSDDRQPGLDALLLEPARRWPQKKFIVAGPLYPETIVWPANVERTIHLNPAEHAEFYAAQKFTLNITRDAMKSAGFSPSVRLFEAGACGVPIISDWWPGLETIFEPDREILISTTPEDTLRFLRNFRESDRQAIGDAARRRILSEHTPEKRVLQLESYVDEVNGRARRHNKAEPKAVSV
jgi:spore maturation protein CgeB